MPQSPSRNSPGAILFDLDGTLVDSAPAITHGLNEMARRRGVAPVNLAAVRRWVSLGGETMLRNALGAAADPLVDLEEFRDILRGQITDPADLYPGVPSMLVALKQRGYRVAICTNKREDIAVPYAAGLGIANHIDAIVGGTPDRQLKPHPLLARLALERLGANPDEAIFVGDSEIDAKTALTAGLRFVLVTFGYPQGDIDTIPADGRLDHFEALPSLVSVMFADQHPQRAKGRGTATHDSGLGNALPATPSETATDHDRAQPARCRSKGVFERHV
ncbi:HAD family hydrolase [Mycolicibacterium rhodesiae]|uniref:Phosphoglycolate phosphatase n=1 Tax=Mycolicibacterium rhodesiae TaxID=36814 RepID=A0A1X0IN41_MYCRH|nr:HAD-IA family hydrolase [Mycolicibacterium rhodesiae]MCV7347650.1 HAD-IA family hydrolase [Mycolicibacterium rhodesiae]ORB49241.1 hypothetical protein BST42_23615 [Mycolicibacterium rhodesiae]